MKAETVLLEFETQRLHLIPNLGGSIAAWYWHKDNGWIPLLRPWDGTSQDRYTFACFPLVPWCNRITGGGFDQHGIFHPIQMNRPGEAYPIHGDGWLQSWQVSHVGEHRVEMSLESDRFDGNPYQYAATQSYALLPHGAAIELTVTHRGRHPLPYGLGLHPYFVRNKETRLLMKASGVWLSGDDRIPDQHASEFPPTWDYNTTAPLEGPLIDNCFTGWDGRAVIEYPDRRMAITMAVADCSGYSLLYRPSGLSYFCVEPITHPIDAFHMPGRPGLKVLESGESMSLKATFAVSG